MTAGEIHMGWHVPLSIARVLQQFHMSCHYVAVSQRPQCCSMVMQDRQQQEDQMQLEAVLRSRDQEVSSLNHRSAHSSK